MSRVPVMFVVEGGAIAKIEKCLFNHLARELVNECIYIIVMKGQKQTFLAQYGE